MQIQLVRMNLFKIRKIKLLSTNNYTPYYLNKSLHDCKQKKNKKV